MSGSSRWADSGASKPTTTSANATRFDMGAATRLDIRLSLAGAHPESGKGDRKSPAAD
jgi:hypothetical protein